jgi:hypothetical protein
LPSFSPYNRRWEAATDLPLKMRRIAPLTIWRQSTIAPGCPTRLAALNGRKIAAHIESLRVHYSGCLFPFFLEPPNPIFVSGKMVPAISAKYFVLGSNGVPNAPAIAS